MFYIFFLFNAARILNKYGLKNRIRGLKLGNFFNKLLKDKTGIPETFSWFDWQLFLYFKLFPEVICLPDQPDVDIHQADSKKHIQKIFNCFYPIARKHGEFDFAVNFERFMELDCLQIAFNFERIQEAFYDEDAFFIPEIDWNNTDKDHLNFVKLPEKKRDATCEEISKFVTTLVFKSGILIYPDPRFFYISMTDEIVVSKVPILLVLSNMERQLICTLYPHFPTTKPLKVANILFDDVDLERGNVLNTLVRNHADLTTRQRFIFHCFDLVFPDATAMNEYSYQVYKDRDIARELTNILAPSETFKRSWETMGKNPISFVEDLSQVSVVLSRREYAERYRPHKIRGLGPVLLIFFLITAMMLFSKRYVP